MKKFNIYSQIVILSYIFIIFMINNVFAFGDFDVPEMFKYIVVIIDIVLTALFVYYIILVSSENEKYKIRILGSRYKVLIAIHALMFIPFIYHLISVITGKSIYIDWWGTGGSLDIQLFYLILFITYYIFTIIYFRSQYKVELKDLSTHEMSNKKYKRIYIFSVINIYIFIVSMLDLTTDIYLYLPITRMILFFMYYSIFIPLFVISLIHLYILGYYNLRK